MMSGRTTPSSPRESSRRTEPRHPDRVLFLPPKSPGVRSQNGAGVLKSRVDLEEDGDDEDMVMAVRPMKGRQGRWFIVDKDSDADNVVVFKIRSAKEDAKEFCIEDEEKGGEGSRRRGRGSCVVHLVI